MVKIRCSTNNNIIILIYLGLIQLIKLANSACLTTEYNSNYDNTETCLPCPSGHTCDGSQTITACALGKYVKNNVCENCGDGFFCPDPTLSDPIPCPVGTYSSSTTANLECTPCEAGKKCPDGTLNSRTDCATGYYSTGYATECSECPAGYECDVNGQLIKSCQPGTYSEAGQSSCTACDAGSFCPDIGSSSSEQSCPKNYYSEANYSQCVPCPAGTSCANNCDSISKCTACSSGQFSLPGGDCQNCPSNYICPDPTDQPEVCPLGYYRSSNTACTICDAGFYCPFLATSQTACPVGSTGNTGDTGSWTCLLCEDGVDCQTDNTSPVNCDSDASYDGKFCQNGLVYDCPKGSYRDFSSNKGRSLKDCAICPAGQVCANAGTTPSDITDCPEGYYCPVGTFDENAFACPPGYFRDSTNGKTIADCQICSAGNYCGTDPGQTEETPCEAGYYCTLGQKSPYENPCPSGTWNDQVGSSSLADCTICPAGSYCPEATAVNNGILCPLGTYNIYTSQGDRINCRPCTPGKVCDTLGQTTVPSQNCPVGHYCPLGTSNSTEFPCQPGTFSVNEELFAPGQCQACPAGFTCGRGLGVTPTDKCPKGYFCPLGSCPLETKPLGLRECNSWPIACHAGQFNDLEQQSTSASCQTCSAGNYCEEAAESETPCPAGYYCPAGTKSADQFPCPAGTYNPNQSGQDENTACIPCDQGKYCPKASINPIPCPSFEVTSPDPYNIGTYADTTGTKSKEECKPCPAGSYCDDNTNGVINPTVCNPGTYSKSNWMKCESCIKGHACVNSNTTYEDMLATPCEAGYYCDQGQTDTKGNGGNNLCVAGSYCPEGTPEMILCPPGTFQTDTGKSSVQDCLPCPVGYYCLLGQDYTAESQNDNQKCAAGFYCPQEMKKTESHYVSDPYVSLLIGSTGDNEVPCPAGTYNPDLGGASINDCQACDEGYFCREGSAFMRNCPEGFYCPLNSTEPTPCPKGTYGLG